MDQKIYQDYVQILKEELVPAMGCTEPIALAYAAAMARETLNCRPDRVLAQVSGSIIKNVKSVIVPNTNHRKGIPAAIAAGIVAGRPKKKLEVIAEVTEGQISEIGKFLDEVPIQVRHIENGPAFNIVLTLFHENSSVKIRAKARAAAGSDARMNGCELPVVINSGSGNQGMTASLPVIEYARELHTGEEKLFRALALSNLTTIHQKTLIGRLSAFCGAVNAGAGAGAGIAYLCGGDYQAVIHTTVNALAIVSGMICDGAKASCAAKIASAVDAGILGYYMYTRGRQFYGGDGIVKKGVEATICSIGHLGRDGMRKTNEEIIKLMMDSEPL